MDEIVLPKPLTKPTDSSTKSFYQNQQNLVIWSIMRIHGCLLKNLVIDKIHNFCWILEKVVFPSEMPLFVGSCYFEFPDPFALFTSLFSTLAFLLLFIISEKMLHFPWEFQSCEQGSFPRIHEIFSFRILVIDKTQKFVNFWKKLVSRGKCDILWDLGILNFLTPSNFSQRLLSN